MTSSGKVLLKIVPLQNWYYGHNTHTHTNRRHSAYTYRVEDVLPPVGDWKALRPLQFALKPLAKWCTRNCLKMNEILNELQYEGNICSSGRSKLFVSGHQLSGWSAGIPHPAQMKHCCTDQHAEVKVVLSLFFFITFVESNSLPSGGWKLSEKDVVFQEL